jgi:nucleoside-diphosphate-sugar epimerase
VRIAVTGGDGFVAGHILSAVRQRGHAPAGPGPVDVVDVVIDVAATGVRAALDEAFARSARLFVFVDLEGRARAEEVVRASGLAFIVVEPAEVWGPGDRLTTEIARLLHRLPFDPVPQGGSILEPVAVADLARAVVLAVEQPDLWNATWSYPGPEALRYGEVVTRVAEAVRPRPRPSLRVPSWALPRRGARAEPPHAPPLPIEAQLAMTVPALRQYLSDGRPPAEQHP